MQSFRNATSFSRFARRAPLSIRQSMAARPISSTPIRLAQGYGDGEGDPRGENPMEQGESNSVKQDAEHPGPPAPSAGEGTGGATKAGSGKSPEDASAQSGGSRSKEAKETGSSPTGGEIKQNEGSKGESQDAKSAGGNAPKIHNQSQPGEKNDKSKQAEVEQHNKEFEQGHDRAPKAEDDKVDKKFWSGNGGGAEGPKTSS